MQETRKRLSGDDGDERAVLGLEVNRLADFKDPARGFLLDHAGCLDAFDEGERAAVPDRRLVGIHFHESIVDSHPDEGGDNMFDSMHFDAPLRQGGGTLNLLDLVDVGGNERLILKVNPSKIDPGIGISWVHGESDLRSGMKRRSSNGRSLGQGPVEIRYPPSV